MDDSSQYTVSVSDFKLFHGIDRALYRILVWELLRNSFEGLYIMGLWLWLERQGFYSFISNVLSLPPFLINELADEAVTCIKRVNVTFPFQSEATEIPLTHSLARKDISLQFFSDRRLTAFGEIQELIETVCVRTMSELMNKAHRYIADSPIHNLMKPFEVSITRLRPKNGDLGQSTPLIAPLPASEILQNGRTLFVTFSKGYPVSEAEVRQFFTSLFGNCIESFQMQHVRPQQQALYAKILFQRASIIQNILNGVRKARFTINGKHVWMRRYVPREETPPACSCVGLVCTCPR